MISRITARQNVAHSTKFGQSTPNYNPLSEVTILKVLKTAVNQGRYDYEGLTHTNYGDSLTIERPDGKATVRHKAVLPNGTILTNNVYSRTEKNRTAFDQLCMALNANRNRAAKGAKALIRKVLSGGK